MTESLPGRAPSGPGGAEGGHPQPPSAAQTEDFPGAGGEAPSPFLGRDEPLTIGAGEPCPACKQRREGADQFGYGAFICLADSFAAGVGAAPAIGLTKLIDPELAHGWQSSEREMRELRADLAAEALPDGSDR